MKKNNFPFNRKVRRNHVHDMYMHPLPPGGYHALEACEVLTPGGEPQ